MDSIHLSACWNSLGRLAKLTSAQRRWLHDHEEELKPLVQQTLQAAQAETLGAREIANIAHGATLSGMAGVLGVLFASLALLAKQSMTSFSATRTETPLARSTRASSLFTSKPRELMVLRHLASGLRVAISSISSQAVSLAHLIAQRAGPHAHTRRAHESSDTISHCVRAAGGLERDVAQLPTLEP